MNIRTSVTIVDLAGPQINQRLASFRLADQYTRSVADRFAQTVSSKAPRETGWLVKSVTEMGSHRGADYVAYGVGPFSKIGSPRASAPRGVIDKFLRDYPQYRMNKGKRTKRRVAGRKRPFPAAWHFLNAEAKRKLRDLRRSGLYGMTGPAPRYWQAIQENRVPGQGGYMGGVDYLSDAYAAARAISRVLERVIFGV